MRRPLVCALVLAVSVTGVWADLYDDCNQFPGSDRWIHGCTQIIERGKRVSRRHKSYAYTNRDNAYDDKGEFDHAINDYTKAIVDFLSALEIDPSNQDAKEGLKRLGVTPSAGLVKIQRRLRSKTVPEWSQGGHDNYKESLRQP